MTDQAPDLPTLKRAAKMAFASLEGFEGIGIGDGHLQVYVRNAQAARQIPLQFHGVELETVVSGEIKAQAVSLIPPLRG